MVTSTKIKDIFITGTDTDVGKTVATLVIATLLKEKGLNVGVFKPVQCAGDDSEFLKENLRINESLNRINPYFASEPLSPNLAFRRKKQKINKAKIISEYKALKKRYDILLIEGAGGLMVPLTDKYLVKDLILDLDCEVVVVSRLGLGTINHTLLTIEQLRSVGCDIKGILFSENSLKTKGIPEKTNPEIINTLSGISVLGTIPYLKNFKKENILKTCSSISLNGAVNKSTNESKEDLVQMDRDFIWHPFTQMRDWHNEEPLVIEKAKGSYLYDTKGNKYLDGVSSLWVNVHGHGKKSLDDAIKNQIDQLSHSTLLGLTNKSAVQLAQKLMEVAPNSLEKVFYSDSGSTAVEIAIKMAYQYWQNIGETKKTGIMHLANSYHGDTLGSVSVGGIDLFHRVYRDLIFEAVQIDFPDCYRAPKNKKYPDFVFDHLKKFEKFLKKEHHRMAAFIVEPIVQGAAGMIIWPKGVLKQMHDICKKYNVLFITDEVATGFGRTGKMFACEHEGVEPDIMALAKGITGGYLPLAATLTSRRVYDGFCFNYKDQKTFFHGHTYTGNPLCCAAALENLKIFEKEAVLSKLQPKIKFLSSQLKMFYNLPSVGDVRQLGFMVGIELVKDKSKKTPYDWEEQIGVQVCRKIREKGVILRPLGNVIVLMPPLSMSKQELGILCKATYWAIKEVTK